MTNRLVAGIKEYVVFLVLLIPTFIVAAAAAVAFMGTDQPSAAVSAVSMAMCWPCQAYDEPLRIEAAR